ncbi:unnamed protein product, partial [Amoebophrya sp. A25]
DEDDEEDETVKALGIGDWTSGIITPGGGKIYQNYKAPGPITTTKGALASSSKIGAHTTS